MADRYAKLKRLLGRRTTAMRDLERWQRFQTSPAEQWRGQAIILEKIAFHKSALDTVEHEIACEMRARLGVPSGHLVILKEAA